MRWELEAGEEELRCLSRGEGGLYGCRLGSGRVGETLLEPLSEDEGGQREAGGGEAPAEESWGRVWGTSARLPLASGLAVCCTYSLHGNRLQEDYQLFTRRNHRGQTLDRNFWCCSPCSWQNVPRIVTLM